ncbi:MAG: metallophosphoesterase, partial [Firmicutes bacterium]|nr:metallophosphoesterase [Bacillota bacterium]
VLGLVRAFGGEVSDLWRVRCGWLALAAFALCYIGGVVNALHIRVKRITVPLDLRRPLRLALLSDLHLGFFSGPRMLPRIAGVIAEQKPDAVLLAGDIFDMDYEDLRRPDLHQRALSEISRGRPVFACGGNHDLLFPDPRKEAFIKGCGIRLLADESVSWQGLTVLGRRDAMDDDRLPPRQVYQDLPKDRPLLVLDHNPRTYREAWEQGAALVVSGHSHGGQTFPGNLLQRLLMPYPIYGHRQEDGRHLVVTSGAGFWGPPLRLGVNNEVVLLELIPASEDNHA